MSDNYINKTKNSHLKGLILLFSIPIGIALFAAAVIYMPRILANPKYDFIYSICDSYSCKNSYSVDSMGNIIQNYSNTNDTNYYNDIAGLRYYESANDSIRTITFEEAQQYKLISSSKSPDGYILSKESSHSGFILWSNYDEGFYLKNGIKKKKIELTPVGSYDSYFEEFVAWVNK